MEKIHKRKKFLNSNSESLQKNLEAIETIIKSASERYSLPYNQIIGFLNEKTQGLVIPTSIVRDAKLGVMEAVVKYLKERLSLTYHEIALLLKRDDRVIWVTYNNAKRKRKEQQTVNEPNYWVPLSIFSNKNLGPTEALSKYLIERDFDYSSTAKLLNKDPKSIWACYKRSIAK